MIAPDVFLARGRGQLMVHTNTVTRPEIPRKQGLPALTGRNAPAGTRVLG